jgi:Family of unknown function (DUF6526)
MSEKRPQTLANHPKLDPWFHFVIVPLLLFCFIASIHSSIRQGDGPHLLLPVFTLTALLLAFRCRIYALKVQDRVIRLEERLRLAVLLPEPLKTRIPDLTERQLIALRFAADEEVPSLVERILLENLDPKSIKRSIKTWRPDYWRV